VAEPAIGGSGCLHRLVFQFHRTPGSSFALSVRQDGDMLVLASQSPRRREILQQAGIPFVVRIAPVDESPLEGEKPREYVCRLAEWKAQAVDSSPEEIVLGADTTVVVDGRMLGKPVDAEDAHRMLRLLAGRKHEVLTGICLKQGKHRSVDCAETSVWFSEMTEEEIAEYVATGEPMDKAGAYAIQGFASKFIRRLDGCYFNVVGLPVSLVYQHLRLANLPTHRPKTSVSSGIPPAHKA
jgi:septum formation protein